jgi:hypothetical protein
VDKLADLPTPPHMRSPGLPHGVAKENAPDLRAEIGGVARRDPNTIASQRGTTATRVS